MSRPPAFSAAGQVTVSCLQLNGHGVLRVEDDGPGIPDAEKEHVFERLQRLDPTQPGGGGLCAPIPAAKSPTNYTRGVKKLHLSTFLRLKYSA
ncbi:MAG: sensor histidine kinase [Burkholderiaceae bacterium]